MTGPSLKTTAAVSLAIHIVFFATTVVIMNSGNHFIRPMPYVVRLVGSDIGNLSSTSTTGAGIQTQKSSDQASADSKTVVDEAKEYAEYRIAALKAKKKAAEAVKLRTTIISLKSSKTSDKTAAGALQSGGGAGGSGIAGGGGIETDYLTKISEEIRQQWAFPEIKGKNFEAIIEVTIMKNGTIIVHNIEKSSGDVLFDSSALRAIKKASPVTPPPYEMKNFGMRFVP